MATIPIQSTKLSRGSHQWTWSNLSSTNADGDPLDPDGGSINFADKTVHLLGDWGTGIEVTVEGSNNGVDWVTLLNTDDGGTLVFTDDALRGILQNPLYIRPRVTAGTGGAVDVIIAGRGILQLR